MVVDGLIGAERLVQSDDGIARRGCVAGKPPELGIREAQSGTVRGVDAALRIRPGQGATGLQSVAEPRDTRTGGAHDTDPGQHDRVGPRGAPVVRDPLPACTRNQRAVPACSHNQRAIRACSHNQRAVRACSHNQRAVVAAETEVVDHDDAGPALARGVAHVVQPRASLAHRIHSQAVRNHSIPGKQKRGDQLQDAASPQRVTEEGLGGADRGGVAEQPAQRSGFRRVVGFRPGAVRVDIVDIGRGQAAVFEGGDHRVLAPDSVGVRRRGVPGVAGEAVAQDLGQRGPASRHLQIPALEDDDAGAFPEIETGGVGERCGLVVGDHPQGIESRHDRERHRVGAAGNDQIQLAPAYQIGTDAHG